MRSFMIILFLLLFFPIAVSGFGVSPASLDIEMEGNENITKSIFLINERNNPVNYTIEGNRFTHIEEDEGTLEPEETRDIDVGFLGNEEGEHEESISILFSGEDEGLIKNRIRVKTKIDVKGEVFTQKKPEMLNGILLTIFIVITGLIIFLIVR
ncbi:MAG: hypothetical protein ACQEP1_02525 [Nanobdellota archaeon]